MFRPILIFLLLVKIAVADWKDLWPATAPGGKIAAVGSEKTSDKGYDKGFVTDIEIPQFRLYQADKTKACGAAIIVFPGGGYGALAIDHEGEKISQWFANHGFTAILVKYRVSTNPALAYQFPVPLLDARRAIRTARTHAEEWGIDPQKIGVIGFSAGGHLASLCATLFNQKFALETADQTDFMSCRPDFAILIYPVIAMDSALTHAGSRKNLLGETPPTELTAQCSSQNNVTAETPPIFLLSTADDSVDCRNSLMFATACKEHGVPVSLHLFETGGHGYGLHGMGDLAAWPSLLETWLSTKFPQLTPKP
jgi:acetyl esterase/lipase